MRKAEAALASGDVFELAAARDMLRNKNFDVGWWGYDRGQVDIYLNRLKESLGAM